MRGVYGLIKFGHNALVTEGLMASWLISTDLDGTLLNHHTYDYGAALPVLKRLAQSGVPVILNSSKTLAEISSWRDQLQLNHPIICENGGIIHFIDQPPIYLGRPLAQTRAFIHQWRQSHSASFEGFADWTVQQIMTHTGLDQQQAALASKREVTEPILWLGDEPGLVAFKQALAEQGLQLQKGGRFYHVMAQHNKATALGYLIAQKYPGFKLMALGDGGNDRAMLEMADIAAVLPDSQGHYLAINSPHSIYHASKPAPEGWAEAVNYALFKEAE